MADAAAAPPAEKAAPAAPAPTPAAEAPATAAAPAAPVDAKPADAKPAEAKPAEGTPTEGEEKKKDPEAAAKRREERREKLKAMRLARKEAAKAAREAGEPPKPRAKRAPAQAGELQAAEGAVPKLSVINLPDDVKSADLKALFEPHGSILRAEVSKRRGRTLGTVLFLTHAEVRKAHAALHGKHKFPGSEEPVSIQYSNDSQKLGEAVKTATDGVSDCLKKHGYRPTVLRSRDAKDLIYRLVLSRRSPPSAELLTAALLAHTQTATADELAASGLVRAANDVQQLLKDVPPATKAEKVAKETRPPKPSAEGKPAAKAAAKAAANLPLTFDAVVPLLDKLEKDRWNRMAKANLRLNERHRFRFVDILATPSLELWRWMVEDCEITPAEAGTCFSILQNHYGFSK